MDMNINFNVVIEAPEIADAIKELATALSGNQNGVGSYFKAPSGGAKLADKATKADTEKPAEKPTQEAKAQTDQPEEETTGDDSPDESETTELTLEDVRALAAEKGRSKRAEVKKLLEKYGADNVSSLDKSKYDAFYADLGVL